MVGAEKENGPVSFPASASPSPIFLYKNSHQGISHNPPLFSQGAELALSSPGPSVLVMAKGSW